MPEISKAGWLKDSGVDEQSFPAGALYIVATSCFEGEELTVYKKEADSACRIGIVKPDGKTASQASVTFQK